MAKVLYTRVSSIHQNLDRQLQEADTYDKVFEDKCSGKNTNRPALQEMLSFVRSGDSLYSHELSRLARNTFDLIDLVNKLLDKGVSVHFLKENLHFSPDKEDSHSRFLLQIFGAVAEFERNLISQRRSEGIFLAKQAGKFKGTKKRLSPAQVQELKEYAQNKAAWTPTALAKRYNICRASVYNYLKV